MYHTKLIAEIGLNHGGSLKRAKYLVKLAKQSGVWGVKFQYFKTNSLFNIKYYKKILNIKSDFQNEIQKLLLTDKEFIHLILYTIKIDLPFGISFFSKEDLTNFIDIYFFKTKSNIFEKINFLKIASGEITDLPLLLEYSKLLKKYKNLEIIISTGLATDEEILNSLSVIDPDKSYKNRIILLHCKVKYPSNFEISNLKRIEEIKKKFGYKSGLSDHSIGIEIPLLSLQYNPDVIEKHFTDDSTLNFADNPVSTSAKDFEKISFIIKNYLNIIGDGIYYITDTEKKEKIYARKGIYAKKDIRINDTFSFDNITTQRPNLEFNDAKYFNLIFEKPSKNFYKKGEPIIINREIVK